MEHIPEDKVDEVLANIRRTVSACYFNIATRQDNFGKYIGDTLHLTVKSAEWWVRQVQKHFSQTVVLNNDTQAVSLLAR
jgi:hypothetical protein